MQTLQLLLAVGILCYSAYSLLAYASRRAGDRAARRDLDRSGTPVRTLTAEEREAVQPFLVDPRRPARAAPLTGDGVFELRGQFLRHGIQGRHGAQTLHDTLAGVDVVLPYDAEAHLQPVNAAQVVLTRRFAVVVALNGGWDLLGGRSRARVEQAGARQWASGAAGEVPAAPPAAEGAGNAAPGAAPGEGAPAQVCLLGQREETAAEAQARAGGSWLPLLPIVPAVAALLVAGSADTPQPWLGAGAALLAAALWLALRPPRTPPRQKVNRAEGPLTLVSLRNPSNTAAVRAQLFLGDRFAVTVPPHWTSRLDLPPDGRARVEVRVPDGSIVRMGARLSIDEEVRRFPLVRWGRHLPMVLGGATLLGATWLLHHSAAADLAHSRAVLGGASTATLRDPAQVRSAPPAPGVLVSVKGQVRCQLAPPLDDGPAPVRCDTVRWGGEPPRVAPVELPPELARVYSGELLQARANPMLGMMMQLRMAQEDGDARILGGAPSIYTVSGVTALVREIARLCGDGAAGEGCTDLRALLGEKLIVSDQEGDLGWDGLVKLAQRGQLKQDGDAGLAASETVARARAGLRAIAAPAVRRHYQGPLQAALDSQRGGLLLPALPREQEQALRQQLARALRGEGEQGTAGDGGEAPDAAAPGLDSTDWPEQWQAYRALAGPSGLLPLELEGMVVGVRRDAGGDLALELDPRRTRENALPALVRTGTLLAGLALLLGHGALLASGVARARRRSRALAAYLDRGARGA